MGVECHPSKPTKCCLRAYLGESAQCPGCDAGIRIDWCAYQPLYRESDNKAVCVVMHRDQMPVLEKLQHHQHVLVGRNDGPNSGIWIQPQLAKNKYVTVLPERQRPQDIYDWLPRLWRYSHLITGDELRGHDVEPEAPPTKAPSVKPASEFFDKDLRKLDRLATAEKRIKAASADGEVVFANLVKKITEGKNGTNGTH